ncbi:hypothetical protein LOTGIDRAFT_154784 [Lottia gigantea]|uniref:XK-related protein n=1 Tax=Lottia gigantea TaxID=225164 RepID=V4A1V6_LOTGI|nr:hypothetical protein LOTGIDRAFT_154784 [Lottia gigantea]ESO87286.1 hypothetical protein LOTGIDRAFT_154784 [Lottia gigantea]
MPVDQIEIELGRSDVTRALDEVDFQRNDVSIEVDRPLSASPDKVDIAFGKGVEKEDRKYYEEYRFDFKYLCLAVLSVILYIGDIISDIHLAMKYFSEGETTFGIVTTVFVAGPSLVMCGFGLHWYWIDYHIEKKEIEKQRKKYDNHWKPVHETKKGLWILRVVMTLLQLGTLMRSVEYIYYGWMSMKSEKKITKIEKLYAWAALRPDEDVVGLSMRIIFLLSSWGSLSMGLTSYHKSLRYSRNTKRNLSFVATPFYFIWRASEVGGRVLCFALFAITYQAWVFAPILLHWLIMIVWTINQKTQFYIKRWQETIFNIVCGYVMIFCFLNLQEGHTRFRYLVFYIIIYFENFVMIGIWFRLLPSQGAWYDLYAFILILVLFVVHIIFQLLYYKVFHPEKIQICLPCDRNLLYESVCHQLTEEEKYPYMEQTIEVKKSNSECSHDGRNSHSVPRTDISRTKHDALEMRPLTTQNSCDANSSVQSSSSEEDQETAKKPVDSEVGVDICPADFSPKIS